MAEGRRRKAQIAFIALSGTLLLACLIGLSVGASSLGMRTSGAILLRRLGLFTGEPWWGPAEEAILIAIRLPRVALAGIVGATLATAGAAFQALFRNPMADPFVLGISPGAALGATVAIVFGFSSAVSGISVVPLAAFFCAIATSWLVYRLAAVRSGVTVESLLLTGIAVGSMLSSGTSLIMLFAQQDLAHVYFWIMGGLSGRSWGDVLMVLPYALISMVSLMVLSRELNAMLLGDEEAHNLGVNVGRTRTWVLLSASLGAAAAVSAAGIVGFVGLMVPHTIRLITGPDHRLLLPSTLVGGALILVMADILARTALAPQEIPLGVVTAILGAPFFLALLRRKVAGR